MLIGIQTNLLGPKMNQSWYRSSSFSYFIAFWCFAENAMYVKCKFTKLCSNVCGWRRKLTYLSILVEEWTLGWWKTLFPTFRQLLLPLSRAKWKSKKCRWCSPCSAVSLVGGWLAVVWGGVGIKVAEAAETSGIKFSTNPVFILKPWITPSRSTSAAKLIHLYIHAR